MKALLVTALTFFIFKTSWCQYYYNDIVSLKQSNEIYNTLKRNNIQLVTATSVEADNTPTTGFAYKRQITNNGSLVITDISLEATGATETLEYYTNNLLSKSIDSSANVMTMVNYKYNDAGNIDWIETETDDTSRNMHSIEVHKWFYTNDIPDSMLRIKDNADTTFVHFKKDDKQNIIEELWIKKNRIIEHYFYYYNDSDQLTDIVRFNTRAQQMLPDFLFAYNNNGVLSQLTQIPQGSSDYVTWQYVYDDRGLKTKDVLFDKHQELLGTVTYTYQ
ncbi:MAG TPA: hypothetical protein VHB70_03065 [Parafilimonas sp.]|nr:hypothetical protein [Parafilimonas sp.]